jgi:hypothetical protein
MAGPENASHCRQKPAFACGTDTLPWTSDNETCPAGLLPAESPSDFESPPLTTLTQHRLQRGTANLGFKTVYSCG